LESIIDSNELKSLVKKTKLEYLPYQPTSKQILAENKINPKLTKTYTSINNLSQDLKGDKTTIRKYINTKSNNLYRKQ
jgi:hypothetical protein